MVVVGDDLLASTGAVLVNPLPLLGSLLTFVMVVLIVDVVDDGIGATLAVGVAVVVSVVQFRR